MDDKDDDPDVGEMVEGPGRDFEIFLKSEDFVDKLKLLNYEAEFLKMSTSYRPIPRHYFARQTNVGEQFFLFTALAAWLIRKAGTENFDMPQEFDDPNATIAGILSALRSRDVSVDFPANKLKSGAGDHCLYVLDALADAALAHTGFTMVPPQEEDEDVEVDAEEDELAEDEVEAASDDDEGAVVIDLQAPMSHNPEDPEKSIQGIMQSDTDAVAWKLEVERVTPQLKITLRQDAKDWRMHLEQMHTLSENFDQLIETVQPQLEQIADELERALERIQTREKTLNQQLSSQLAKFRTAQDSRAESRERYKSASVGITERSATLARISEELEQVKQQIEEQGAKNNDGAPMVKVKQALAKIEADIQKMSVQIGVIEQGLLDSQLKERVAFTSYGFSAY